MKHEWKRIAADVLNASSRQHPADAVLREKLKVVPGLSADDARAISQAVFAAFRWHGWLDTVEPLTRLERAVEMAKVYAARPQCIADEELGTRAVPPWTTAHMAVSPAWLRAIQHEPHLWLRARAGQGTALARTLGESRASLVPALADAVKYCGVEDLFRSHEFHAGEFEIQDIASQAIALVAAPKPGQTWWDACAGSGGKTLHLSDLMHNQGLIWASDRAPWRLDQLKRRAARAGCFNYRAARWDGSTHLPTRTRFDGVLVDAPCSGLGTWQRNPHARWTTAPGDVCELAAVQLRLLTHAARAVKPGGRLVYAVCTLTREETEDVTAAFGAAHPAFAPWPHLHPWRPTQAPSSNHEFWPQDTGGGGMFVAQWRREG